MSVDNSPLTPHALADAPAAERPHAAKRQLRVEEYRRLAKVGFDLADSAALEHVRDKHRLSAQVWSDLADAEENRG